MSIFCYKKIETTGRLGEKFRKKRVERGLTLVALSETTRIPIKYLEAIECDDFLKLPLGKPFRLAYIREIASVLGFSPEQCIHQLESETDLDAAPLIHPRRSIKLFPFSSVSIFLRNGVLASFVLLFAGYLIWQIRGIVEPPRLSVYSPLEGHVVSQPTTVVQGETEKESRLTVNGQEIMVSESGRFETKIDLSNGVNTIVIEATKKHGKTTSVTRHLVVKQKIKPGPLSLGL